MNRCETCQHWRPFVTVVEDGDNRSYGLELDYAWPGMIGTGLCTRHAPGQRNPMNYHAWPTTIGALDFCGDYQPLSEQPASVQGETGKGETRLDPEHGQVIPIAQIPPAPHTRPRLVQRFMRMLSRLGIVGTLGTVLAGGYHGASPYVTAQRAERQGVADTPGGSPSSALGISDRPPPRARV